MWILSFLIHKVGVWRSHSNSKEDKIHFEEVKRLNRNYSFPLKGRTVSVVMILVGIQYEIIIQSKTYDKSIKIITF